MIRHVAPGSLWLLPCVWLLGCEPEKADESGPSPRAEDAKPPAESTEAEARPPEAARPEAAGPEVARPETGKPEAAEPETAKPDAEVPVVTETVVSAEVPTPHVDKLETEWSPDGKAFTLDVSVEVSSLDPSAAGDRPVLTLVCMDGDVQRVGLVRIVEPRGEAQTRKLEETVSFAALHTPCRVQVLLPGVGSQNAKVLEERCLGDAEACKRPFTATVEGAPFSDGAIVSADAPSWVRYTGAKPHGWDVSVDVDLEVTRAVDGLGRIQAFAACAGAEEEELSFDDDDVAYIDDLAWVAPGQHVRVRGSTVAYLEKQGKKCNVRITARPEKGEAVDLVRWCLDGKKARPGACE